MEISKLESETGCTCAHVAEKSGECDEQRCYQMCDNSRGSVIFDDLSPTHGALPITPLIDIPKGISSKMGLEVA